MRGFELEFEDLKHYPHFDAQLSLKNAQRLVSSPPLVARNPFYPFIMYEQRWQPFRSKKPRPDKKVRKIRYAARKDAVIFGHYRSVLAVRYEEALKFHGLQDAVLAYRRVHKDAAGRLGKCNIDFAKTAFDAILSFPQCSFMALDISKFFESLDHCRLYSIWCQALQLEALPSDHAAVFSAITKYSYVEREELYRRLGFIGLQDEDAMHEKYLRSFDELPRKLCSNAEFREKVAGKGSSLPSIIQFNRENYGIPQGAAISDLLANMYLLDFDIDAKKIADSHGGIYQRYSDDILFILPIGDRAAVELEKQIEEHIQKYGSQLKINTKKTSIIQFKQDRADCSFELIKGTQGRNGAEYLGFRFDGKKVYLRDGTLSNLFRKISLSAKAHCHAIIKRYPGKDKAFLKSKISENSLVERFGKARDFDPRAKKTWTFWSYAKRSAATFGGRGQPILKQIKNRRVFMEQRLNAAIEQLLSR
jgi:Reverse transcriptase (RNA-dependent DNA polymerase)